MTRVVLLLPALLTACGVTIPGAGTTDTTGPPDITLSTGETGSSGQDTASERHRRPWFDDRWQLEARPDRRPRFAALA